MKGIIYFAKAEDKSFSDNYMLYPDFIYDYSVKIFIDINDSYDKIITNSDEFNRWLKFINECEDQEVFEDLKDALLKYKGKEFELVKDVEYVLFEQDYNFINDYINNNPKIKNKKIVIPIHSPNYNDILNIEKIFKENVSCLYFKLDENSELIDFNACKQSLKIVDDIVSKIKKLNLSPLEQVMYVYDKVKSRIYKKESDFDKKSLSRDMSSVLLQDSIVCLGYSNIICKVLNELNIQVDNYLLHNIENDTYHARNVIYLKDSKYKIDGIYFLDATWDSKKYLDDDTYLSNYMFFMKTKEELENEKFEELTFGEFNLTFIKNFENEVETKELANIDHTYIEIINSISNFLDGKNLIKSYMLADEKIKSFFVQISNEPDFDLQYTVLKLHKYNDLLNKKISGNILLEALFNVRKVEYYEDTSVRFDRQEFLLSALKSNWVFSKTKQERVLELIFNEDVNLSNPRRANASISESNIPKEIEEVKLARVLRKVLEKK